MKNLKPNDVAKKLNVTVRTLQRWDRDGILKAYRTPTGRRYYTEEDIDNFGSIDLSKCCFKNHIIDRGYRLVWKYDLDNESVEWLEDGNAKVYLINTNNIDNDIFDSDDALYEEIFTAHSLEYNLNGLVITNSLIYNAILDYIIFEFKNGNQNAGDLIYPLLEEHSKLQKIVKKYVLDILKD